MVAFAKNIIQLVLSPTSGWEDISLSNPDPKEVARKFMYPLFGVASLSVFLQGHFHAELQFSYLLIMATATFSSLFVGYIVTELLMRLSSAGWIDGEVDSRRCSTVVVFSFSMLALAMVVCNLLPLSLGLPYLLPLGVAMVIWKSTTYLHIKKESEFNFMTRMVLSVVCIPALIRMMFEWVIS